MNPAQIQLEAIHSAIAQPSLPPVHEWQPKHTADIDIRILRNGDWLYHGSKIQRQRMVRLFSTVLRVDEDGETYLVTPQSRLRIQIDDAPFTAVLLEQQGEADSQKFIFTTNIGDQVVADSEHPVTVEYASSDANPAPYIHVRDRLRALISRSVFYQLAGYAEQRDGQYGVTSQGCFMPLGAV